MRKLRWIVLALALTWFGGGTAHADEPDLAGTWFTQGEEKNEFIQVIQDLKPDGSFRKDIRVIALCEVTDQGVETGNWTLIDKKLREYTFMVKNRFAPRLDDFRIDAATPNLLDVTDIGTDLHWTMKRLAPGATFPPVEGCPTS